MHNYRGKRLKTHKKHYQVGGVIGTPEQRAEANLTAQRLAAKYQLMDAPNMQIGEFLPEYVDPSGRPAQPLPTVPLPTRLPSHIRPEDVQQEQGIFYYIDPRDDSFREVSSTIFRGRQFQKPIEQVNMDQAGRNVALRTQNMSLGFRYGGRKQRGGLMYDQQYNDEKRQQAMQAGEARMLMAPQPDLSYNPMNPQFGNQLAANTQTNIGNGSQFQDPNQPTLDNDWMTPLGIGLMGSRGVLSEISGRVARKRQDNYDATQQRLFNNKGEVNLNDYQPSPYSLYARYGGKLKNYQNGGITPSMGGVGRSLAPRSGPSMVNPSDQNMYDWYFQQYLNSNPAARNPNASTLRNPLAVSAMADARGKLPQSTSPELFNLYSSPTSTGNLALSNSQGQYVYPVVNNRPMKHGGNPAMAAYHDLPMDDYNMIMMQQQQQVPEGFHLMPDGTLMPDNQMYKSGGKNYRGKKKK